MLVVVFDDESKASDGHKALKELDSEGSISVHAEAVIKKTDDGAVLNTEPSGEDFPVRTVGGTAIGALIGLLGGPIVSGIGSAIGFIGGAIGDLYPDGVNAEFLDDVSDRLTPGKWAIVADVTEDRISPVDARMEALGGTVFRIARKKVEHEQFDRDVAAIKAGIAQLKAEQTKSRADQKAKFQTKIDNLKEKLSTKLEAAKLRLMEQKKEAEAKVQALDEKAAKSKGEAKAKIETRINKIKEKYKRDEEAFERWSKKNEEDNDEWMTGHEPIETGSGTTDKK